MKTGATAINAHLAMECTTLTDCIKVVLRDGTIYGFTSHDQDIIYDGLTYARKSAFTRSNVSEENGITLDTFDLTGLINTEQITENDIRSRRLDGAELYHFLINWATPTQGIIKLMRGTFGDITLKSGVWIAEINGLGKVLQNEFLRIYSPLCDAEFGDSATGCGFDLATVRQTGSVDSVSDNKNFVTVDITISANDEFNLGRVAFTSGLNSGITVEIKDSATSGAIELYIAAPFTIAAGDTFTIVPGCNKLFTTCQSKGQTVNFRGFPDLPGEDARFVTDMALSR